MGAPEAKEIKSLKKAALAVALSIGGLALVSPNVCLASGHAAAHPAPEHGHEVPHVSEKKGAPEKGEHEKKPSEHSREESPAKPSFLKSYIEPFAHLWSGFVSKVDQLRFLDETNEALRTRIAELELENKSIRSKAVECEESQHSEKALQDAKNETGVRFGRTIATLSKEAETAHGDIGKILEQARLDFQNGDFEKAAGKFLAVTKSAQPLAFDLAAPHYWLAISLFKLSNYKMAVHQLDQAVSLAESGKASSVYAPRALAWKFLAQGKVHDEKGKQETLKRLINRYPSSPEARRLNRGTN